MNNNFLATMEYKDFRLEYCIFDHNAFYLGRYISDSRQYDTGVAILGRHNISKLILSSNCNHKIYTTFKITNIEIELLNKKHFIVRKRLDDELSFGCLNAMIYYLETNVMGHHVGYLNVLNLKSIEIGTIGKYKVLKHNLNDFLYIDYNTIQDLRLKEDLFLKINFTKTIYGKKQLLRHMLFPFKKKIEILQRQKQLNEIMNISLTAFLKKIKGIEPDGVLNIYKLPLLLNSVIDIHEMLKNTSIGFKSIKHVKQLSTLVDIFDEKELKPGLFPEYDQLQTFYLNLPQYLSKIAKNITKDISIDLNIIYMPQIGYLIELNRNIDIEKLVCDIPDEFLNEKKCTAANAMENSLFTESETYFKSSTYNEIFIQKVNNISQLAEDITNKDIYKFSTSLGALTKKNIFKRSKKHSSIDTLSKEFGESKNQEAAQKKLFKIHEKFYVKNKVMKLLDKEFGDLSNLIEEFKCFKIKELREIIARFPLDEIFEYIGTIDALNSLKLFSLTYKCCMPKISKEKKVKIKNIWNYNADIEITKNIIYFGSDNFLKLIGEMIILFQMGSNIPALDGEFYIFDQLYTSIQINESIIDNTSYFLASLKNISRILNQANSDSVCLIKNFGDGTNISIGIQLFYEIHKKIQDFFVISLCNFKEIFNHYEGEEIDKASTLIESTNHIIPDVPNESTFELKKNSLILSQMSSIYYQSKSIETCKNCLCTSYDFKSIDINLCNILITTYNGDRYSSYSFLDNFVTSKKFKDLYYESLELIKNDLHNNDQYNMYQWAIKTVNDFIKKHRKIFNKK